MPYWFEKYPERYDFETDELRSAGFAFSIDQQKKAAGSIEITVQYPLDGVNHDLLVQFPDDYPFLPFIIRCNTLPAGRHICANTGTICFMQSPQTKWRAREDFLAGIIQNEIKTIIGFHLDPSTDKQTDEGLQRSGQYPCLPESVFLTQDWSIPKDVKQGRITIGMEPSWNTEVAKIYGVFRGVVTDVADKDGKSLAKMDPCISRNHNKQVIIGRWVRLDAPPDGSNNGGNILNEAIRQFPSISNTKPDKGFDIVGILFPEESSKGVVVENWLFVVRFKNPKVKNELIQAIVRTDCIDKDVMMARVASLSPLSSKRVLIIGAGSIGSTLAWQFARAGVGYIDLIDHDFVQSGNLPRWLPGLGLIGRNKATAVRDFIASSYPYTSVTANPYQIGCVGENATVRREIDKLLSSADMVIDATAEFDISNMLNMKCLELGKPFLWATGTPGSRGGVVGRVVPGKTEGCWSCFQHQQDEGSIVIPAQDNKPDIQPKGCFHPTFTGTGFDMDNISLAATRLAVSTLCEGEKDAYPTINWDIGVVSLWDKDEITQAPQWNTYSLNRHIGCGCHG